MAKDVKIVNLCDPCNEQNFTDIEAVATHTLSLDGGPPVEIELCERDEMLFFRVYRGGREIEPPKPLEPEPKKPQRVKAAKPKELEPVQPELSEQQPAEEKQYLLCTRSHASVKGHGPMMVNYEHRGTHARAVHDRGQLWDVVWQDPNGIITVYCDEHDFCKATRLGFTSKRGLAQHISYLKKNPPHIEPSKEDGDVTRTHA